MKRVFSQFQNGKILLNKTNNYISNGMFKLQLWCEVSKSQISEDDEYEITYHVKNIGDQQFPSGWTFDSRLCYPYWDRSYSVLHIWRNIPDAIDIGNTYNLKPYKIKAVSGPNAIVFQEISLNNRKINVFDQNNNEIQKGSFLIYYRIMTKIETSSITAEEMRKEQISMLSSQNNLLVENRDLLKELHIYSERLELISLLLVYVSTALIFFEIFNSMNDNGIIAGFGAIIVAIIPTLAGYFLLPRTRKK